MNKDFYTVKEFAEQLGISVRTVQRMIEIGKINGFRAGPSKLSPYRIPHTEIIRMATKDFEDLKKGGI